MNYVRRHVLRLLLAPAFVWICSEALAQESPLPFSVEVIPAYSVYQSSDTAAIVLHNLGRDTIRALPRLGVRRGADWAIAVADVRSMGLRDGRAPGGSPGAPASVPPGGDARFAVSMADVVRAIPPATPFRFELLVERRKGDGGYAEGQLWARGVFTVGMSLEDSLRAERPSGVGLLLMDAPYDTAANAPTIPAGLFARAPYRLVLRLPAIRAGILAVGSGCYALRRPSAFARGLVEIVVTRRQIWLRSVDTARNTGRMYWYTEITDEQYTAVAAAVKRARVEAEREGERTGHMTVGMRLPRIERPIGNAEVDDPEGSDAARGLGRSRAKSAPWASEVMDLPGHAGAAPTDRSEALFLDMLYDTIAEFLARCNRMLPAAHAVRAPSRRDLEGAPPVTWIERNER